MYFEQNTYDDGTYLLYRIEDNQKIDQFALNTIMNNTIDGVFKINKENDNGQDVFYINITSKIALSMLLDKPVRRGFVLNILESMARTSLDADEYLLDPKYFLFDYDNIFIDLSTQKVSMIYLPIEREEKEINIKDFIKNFLFDLSYETKEDCNYVAHLINVVNSKDRVTMDRLVEVINEIRKRIVKRPVAPQGTPATPMGAPAVVGSQQPPLPNVSQNQRLGYPVANQNIPQNFSPKPVQTPTSSIQQAMPQNQNYGMQIPGNSNNAVNSNEKKNESSKRGFFKFGKSKDAAPEAKTVESPIPSPVKPEKEKKKGLFGAKEKKSPVATPSSGLRIPGMDTPEPIIPPSVNQQNKYVDYTAQNTPPIQQNNRQQVYPQSQNVNVPQTPKPVVNNEHKIVRADEGPSSGTVILGGAAQSGKTVFKKAVESKGIPGITRISTNETRAILKTPFKIGKERDFVDYYISGNATVSRVHAQITQENGQYYIEDSNSLNHTYLGNDTSPIQSGKAYPISSGTHFRLSDEEFVFLIK